MDRDAAIVTANRNQQTDFKPQSAVSNITASAAHKHVFDGSEVPNKDKPVVFVGGGSADDFDAVTAVHGGDENLVIVATGSAAFRLNKAAQEADGYPWLERADAVVLNRVDGPDDDGKMAEYYGKVAAACALHPGVTVYLSSYNGPEAYAALPEAIRVNGVMEGAEYPEGEPVVGLGSTAPTAATIIAMMQGHKEFEFVGVTGAVLQTAPDGAKLSDGAFTKAAEVAGNPDRYTEYDIGVEAWRKIDERNQLLVYVGDNEVAVIPSGQWYQLEEMRKLAEWGRENGMRFTFHGDNSLSKAVLMDGQDVTLAYDPRGVIEPGTKMTGLTVPASNGPISDSQPSV